MKAIVDQDICIGCGACVSTYPKIFSFNEDGKATATDKDISEIFTDFPEDCAEICPVSAISITKEDKIAESKSNKGTSSETAR